MPRRTPGRRPSYPPVFTRFLWVASALSAAPFTIWVVFRCARALLGEEPGRAQRLRELYWTVAIQLVLWAVFLVWYLRKLRRWRRDFRAAGGRLCTHCAYDVSSLGEQGTCPECGRPFDSARDAASWKKAGFGPKLLRRP